MKICDRCKKRATTRVKIGSGKDAEDFDLCDEDWQALSKVVHVWLDEAQKKLEERGVNAEQASVA